jgi:hypothetical protein
MWLLDFMSRMNAYGSLRKMLLRNRENKIIGWYLYYLRQGGVGEVVQVGASPSSVNTVLDHLSHDAWAHGAIALHGRLDPYLSQESLGKYCFYFLGNRLLVHSRDLELVRHIQSGGAYLTRLDGEWCLRFGTPDTATRSDGVECRLGTTDSGLTTQHMGHGLKTTTCESAAPYSCHNSPLDRGGPLSGGLSRRLNAESR